MTIEQIRAYYDSFGAREWQRLQTPEGRVEWAVSTETLRTYLPSKGRVLDLGGGPGRYAIWLAQRGYRVVLADISPAMLDLARERIAAAGPAVSANIEAVIEGDACDLPMFSHAEFDAVLCLGPFYHLPEAADRSRAGGELKRLVKPGGMLAVMHMSRYALLRRTLALPDERHHLRDAEWLTRLLNDGIFYNEVAGRFNSGYGARPQEIAPFFESFGFRTKTLLATDGLLGGLADAATELAESDPAAHELLMRLAVRTANDPALHGNSGHLLYIGTRAA